MDILSSIFPYFIFLLILLSLWSLYDRYHFTRFEGSLKRGVMIWAGPLSWEARQFLEGLPSAIQVDQSFIRKENNEVLLVEKSSFLSTLFRRRRQLPCIAYVNLSAPENQIEIRTSFSTLASLTVSLIVFFIFFAIFFTRELPVSPPGFWIFPIVFLSIFVGSFLFGFYQARQRLLKFLEQMMSQQRSGSNIGF